MDEFLKTLLFQVWRQTKGVRCDCVSWPTTVLVVLTWLRWHDGIRTLAKLHRLSPAAVGLSSFGKPSGFYNRQLKTFGTISESQAQVIDVETHVAVGKIPHFEDMVTFFSDPKAQPKERATLIHGDYKIDNLVYHRTEPRVIGILE